MATTIPARAAARPPVHLIDRECDMLVDLALQIEGQSPEVAAMLLGEIERAETHAADALPPGTVTIGSEVDFLDESTHRLRTVTLVMPGEADIRIRELLERPEVQTIHAHNAAHGCFLARIERN